MDIAQYNRKNNTAVSMIMDIEPVPASRPRVSRYSTYFGKRYTQFRKDMKCLTSHMTGQALQGELEAIVSFYVKMPSSWTKTKKKALEGAYSTNRADIDNYVKALLDCLNGVLFEDDHQVVSLKAEKRYSSEPRIDFQIKRVEE